MPTAPEPTFDSRGNLVAAWQVVVDYSPTEDVIRVSASQQEGAYHSAKRWDETYPVVDVEDAIKRVQTHVRILGARRLL